MTSHSEKVEAMEKRLFESEVDEDPWTRTRTVPMEVLNMSVPRTGSMSIKAALEILGYKTHHSTVLVNYVRDIDMWSAALEAKYFPDTTALPSPSSSSSSSSCSYSAKPLSSPHRSRRTPFGRREFDSLLGHWSAVSADAPACAFAAELIAAYPEARVILVEREAEGWLRSYGHIVDAADFSRASALADALPGFLGRWRRMTTLWVRGWMRARDAAEHRRNACAVRDAHYALVRRVTPPHRLLEYRLGQGWEPLCAFLDKPVPDLPFPHVNDGDDFTIMTRLITRRGMRKAALTVLFWTVPLVAAVAAALMWYFMFVTVERGHDLDG